MQHVILLRIGYLFYFCRSLSSVKPVHGSEDSGQGCLGAILFRTRIEASMRRFKVFDTALHMALGLLSCDIGLFQARGCLGQSGASDRDNRRTMLKKESIGR